MKTRLITSMWITLVLVAALAGKLLYAGVFDILVGCISVLGCLEISQLFTKMRRDNNNFVSALWPIFFYIALQLGLLLDLSWWGIMLIELGVVAALLVTVIIYKSIQNKKSKLPLIGKERSKSTMQYVMNTLYVMIYPGLCFIVLFCINNFEALASIPLAWSQLSFIMLAMCLLVSSLTDIFAYIFGSMIKGPKLAPKITPKKTISGSLFGLLGGMLAGIIVWGVSLSIPVFAASMTAYGLSWWVFLLAGLFGSIVGQAGDLLESVIKRRAGVKDSGTCLPGHGGMMDRVDNLCLNSIVILIVFALVIMM